MTETVTASMTGAVDHLLEHVRVATLESGTGEPYGLIDDGAVAIQDDRIAWVGPHHALPRDLEAKRRLDCEGRLLTPGLIDCHTHLVWGGDRLDEFEARLAGGDYAAIAKQGGGIASTMRATRAADDATLLAAARRRAEGLIAEGVTRIEIKSGYGLDTATEFRMLDVARQLGRTLPVTVHTTFLGAHAVPPEYQDRADDYLSLVIEEMLPAVAAIQDDGAPLADAVDAFLEHIAFSPAQVERLFTAARAFRLPVKLHAEQLSNQGGAALAARFGALSADHLEYLDEDGVRAMAAAGTVAVLLPGAYFFLRETVRPPVEALRAHGVPIALATDLNPGSSPLFSLRAAITLGAVLFHLMPEEALAAVTRHAATALGVGDEVGTITTGKRADLALWDVTKPAALVAELGTDACYGRFVGGAWSPRRASRLREATSREEAS